MKYSPLHSLQPEYSMFKRDIEKEIIPFCIENNIAIITYAPLYSGLLTGKFFLEGAPVPDDTNRRMKRKNFEEPFFSINKETLQALKNIADQYGKTLTQLAINWNFNQKGVTSTIVGIRNPAQAEHNLRTTDRNISETDMQQIDQILQLRVKKISAYE